MKRNNLLSACLLVLLGTAVQAHAVDIQCVFAGGVSFVPAHPGVGDIITYSVQLGPGQPRPAPFQILNKVIVGPGKNIEIDTVVTADASQFPGYAVADPTPQVISGQSVYGGTLGSLAQGQYSVVIDIATYDAASGVLVNDCGGPWSAGLVVSDQPAPTETGEVVEFHSVALDRYFITQDILEMMALDSGQIKGWSRTGLYFLAYLPGMSDGRGIPMVRWYKSSSVGHLFTHVSREFDYLNVGPESSDWQIETFDAFEIPVPSVLSGACATGTTAVYRLWDARADADHRYTTDRDVRQQMIDSGYIAEGFGADSVFLCALAP